MGSTPIKIDPSTVIPFETEEQKQARELRQSVSFGAQQNPDQYAKLLKMQQQTGVAPLVAQGNEAEVQHAADVDKLDYPALVASHPRTVKWASNPDNAAVAGVDEVQRLADMEARISALPSFGERLKQNYDAEGFSFIPGGKTAKALVKTIAETQAVRDLPVNYGKTLGQAMDDARFLYEGINKPLDTSVLQPVVSGVEFMANNRPEVTKGVIPDAVWNVIGGVSKAEARVAGGLATPKNLAILVGASDLSPAAKALMDTYFASEMIPGVVHTPQAIMQAPNAQEKISAGLEGLVNAWFTMGVTRGIASHKPFYEDMAHLITYSEQSKLKARSPEKFYEAISALSEGSDSLRIPVEQFDTYFQSKNLDPAQVAEQIGAKNYLEAKVAGADVEVAPADFIGKLDSEHQKGLLGDLVNPQTGMTFNAEQKATEEIQKWVAEGGPEKLIAETQKVDAETQASDEYQSIKTQLRQQYEAAGETPEVADSYATLQANVYSNLARETGMKASELMGLYRPVIKLGEEAPQSQKPKYEKEFISTMFRPDGELYKVGDEIPVPRDGVTLRVKSLEGKTATGGQWYKFETIYNTPEAAGATTLTQRPPSETKARSLFPAKSSFSSSASSVWLYSDGKMSEGIHSDVASQAYGKKPVSDQDTSLARIKKFGEETGAVRMNVGTRDTLYLQLFGEPTPQQIRQIAEVVKQRGYEKVLWEMPNPDHYGEGSLADFQRALDKEFGGEILRQGERGWFRVLPDGSFEIGKTKIGDLSTFVHEPAHSYLFLISDLAKREGASENLKGDYQKILDFLGAKDGEALTTEQHEKWARANEQYLREGIAPSPGLRGVFQRFAVWLSSIYKRASDLGVELSDDIRGVFDRLYAAEDGVNRAAKESGPRLFSTPEEAGWTPEQFQAYAESKGMEVEQAKAEILAKMNEAAVRERSEAWREEEKTTREAVAVEIDRRPEYVALRSLQKGKLDDGTPLTLNRDELIKQFGKERTDALRKQHIGIYRNEGGVDAETAAEILGFNSGEEMIRALETAPRRSAAIDQATREYMTAKHGDIRYDGTLDDQARIALESDKKASNLHKELKALQKKLTEVQAGAKEQKAAVRAIEIPPIEAFRNAAETMVADKPLMDLQPNRYLDASRKASREAFDALRKGDIEEAKNLKQKELINHFLFREAVKAKDEAGSIRKFADTFKKASQREKLAKAGGPEEGQHVYLDQADNILAMFRFTNESNKSIQQRQLEFRSFAALKQAEAVAKFHQLNPDWAANHPDGELPDISVQVDTSITSNPRNYRELNIVELRAVRDALRNIRAQALNEYTILVNGKRVALDQAAADAVRVARENVKSTPVPRSGATLTIKERGISLVQGLLANNQKLEWFINLLDGGDINGPWRKMIKKPIDDSNGVALQLSDDVNKALQQQKRPKGLEESTSIMFPNQPDRPMSRYQLVSWLFNMGTEENRKVALIGEGLVNENGTINPVVDKVLNGTFTKDELMFVQNGWNTLEEKVWPAVRERHMREKGAELTRKTKVAFDVTTVDGEVVHMEGGYYPLKADYSDRVSVKQDPAALITFGSQKPKTSTSARERVTGATYRLKLDFESVLSQHLNDVIKDAASGEAIDSVYRFITHEDVRTTLRETLGAKVADEFMVWLQDFNGNQRPGVTDKLGVVNFLLRRKTGVVAAQLGGNISSVAVQVMDFGKVLSAPDLKNRYLMKAFIDIRRNPTAMLAEIRQKSPNEMRFREHNFNREFADSLKDRSTFDAQKMRVTDWVFQSFAVMDRLVSFTAWLARYRQGLEEHGNESQAIMEADRLVARTVQAGDNRNMSRIMRSQGLVRLLTTFQGDANTWFGLIASSVHTAAASKSPEIRNAAIRSASVGLLALFADQVVGQYIRNRGKKDDETWPGWATEQALLGISNLFPVYGDVAQFAIKKAEGEYSSVQNPTYGAIERSVKGAAAAFNPEKDWQERGQGLTEAVGIWNGIPGTVPIVRGWRYVHNVEKGKEPEPRGAVEAVRGVTQGSNRKR